MTAEEFTCESQHVCPFHCTPCWGCILIATWRQVWQNALTALADLSRRQCGNQYIYADQRDGDCSKDCRGEQNH
jgi:hypothetical protein